MLRETATPKKRKRVAQPTLVGKHLVIDPAVCHGELTFRGTRVPVRTILLNLAKGHSYLRKSWPEVTPAAIEEALALAAEVLTRQFKL
jgi:uncharacterized protein (DUF433 family)